MAKKAMILKQQAEAKYSSRRYNRCKICGRPHAYLRDYGVCRICFLQGPDSRCPEGQLVIGGFSPAPSRKARSFRRLTGRDCKCQKAREVLRRWGRFRPAFS